MNTESWSCDDKLAELVALWNDLEQTTLLKRFAFGRALVELIDESLELTIEDVAERLRVGPRTLYVVCQCFKAIPRTKWRLFLVWVMIRAILLHGRIAFARTSRGSQAFGVA